MRVLFACSLGGAGHIQPLLPFLAAAQSRGDEVLVAVPPAMAYHVERAGYYAHVCGEPPEEELAPLRELLPKLPAAEALVAGNRDLFARLAATAMLPGMERLISSWSPDLVVRDPCEYASAVVAERHGLAHLQVAISPAEGEMASIWAASPALEEHLPGLTSALVEGPYLSRFPASMDRSPFPVTRRYREIAGSLPESEPLPDWWDGADGPLVYMTFGTVLGFMTIARQVFRTALDAVSALGETGVVVRVLLTTGHRFAASDLGELPRNVHAEPWVDQALVLPHAELVVCHGGSGTMLGTLAAGVPLVVVPSFADQFGNGRSVQACGAGRTVEAAANDLGGDRSPVSARDVPRIAEAIRQVLTDSSYRRTAERIAGEIAAAPLPAAVLAGITG